jgi:choline-sulfatase
MRTESKASKDPMASKEGKASKGRKTLAAIAFGLLLLVAAGWWWTSHAPTVRVGDADLGALPAGVRPSDLNLVVITLDTTRADRIGAYGDSSGATPIIDRLARDGVVFEHAVAPAPLTLPAHSTLFTGMDPPFHGVRDNGGYILEAGRLTLAEQLKQAGWTTGAFVGAFVLDSKFGLDQGFDEYFDRFNINQRPGEGFALGDVARPAAEVVDAALPWLEQQGANRFFAWLHFYDPHTPYDPPEPWKRQYANRPYLGEIAYVDAQIGRVVAWLEERSLLEKTLIVVIGDHGESLGEHGESTHGLFIYDASIRVPFVIRAPYPALRGRRVTGVVRTQDVLPTTLALLGQQPVAAARGTSLVPLMAGTATDLNLDAYSESLYARNHFGWSELRAFRAGRYKLIDAPRPELYDLEADPRELTNVYEERRTLADRLRVEIRRLSTEAESGATSAPTAIDPETRERLAALGYVGTFTETTIAEGQTLPDPKDKISVFNLMLSAREDRSGNAIATLQKVVAADPQIIDAWTMIGNEYFRQKDYARAITYYKKALELRPGYDLATINLANAYRRSGDDEAAMVGYEQYLQRDPRNAYVRYQLGEIQSDRGKLDDARQSFAAALQADPTLASARNALGVLYFKQGRIADAEREIRAAIAAKPDVRLAYFNLAVIAESQGRLEEAEQLYLKDLEVHPNNHRSHFNLGRLYEARGDRERQIAAWQGSLRANPEFPEGHILLAQLYLKLGRDRDEALRLAKRGVELGPRSQLAPLGRAIVAGVEDRH